MTKLSRSLLCLLMLTLVTACQAPLDSLSVVRIAHPNGKGIGTGFVVARAHGGYLGFTASHVASSKGFEVDGAPIKIVFCSTSEDVTLFWMPATRAYRPLGFAKAHRGQRAMLLGYPGATNGFLSQTTGTVICRERSLFSSRVWYDGGILVVIVRKESE